MSKFSEMKSKMAQALTNDEDTGEGKDSKTKAFFTTIGETSVNDMGRATKQRTDTFVSKAKAAAKAFNDEGDDDEMMVIELT